MNNKSITFRLILLNFLEFAVWGAYLTSLGRYLGNIGLGNQIKWFFAMQGIVSIFMPTLMGILADRKIRAQKVLSMCHLNFIRPPVHPVRHQRGVLYAYHCPG